jgi:hypothetical protein
MMVVVQYSGDGRAGIGREADLSTSLRSGQDDSGRKIRLIVV